MQELSQIFTDSEYYVEEPLTPDSTEVALDRLGYRLPDELLALLSKQNGGTLRNQCLPVDFPNSWAQDHISIKGLLGLGNKRGMDSDFGSSYLIREWGYPAIGVVFAATPSGGHDAVMLDFEDETGSCEPRVVYVDEDRIPRLVAASFSEFLANLLPCSSFP